MAPSKSTAAAAASPAPEYFAQIALDAIERSPTNPRTHFPGAYLAELAQSIKEKGLVQPIVVRDVGGAQGAQFEIVAGECRYRASKLAGLTTISAVVRDYTDEQVLEVQLIENIHRTDLTPLEQAAGYRRLIASNPTKHSAETIAQRIGMSPAWVWDRLKLNDLVEEAKAILEQEWMSVGHAILIARLKPADQKRVISTEDDGDAGGLWRHDAGFNFDETDPANRGARRPTAYERLKPCSVRELEAWIRDHVRFDVAHAAKAQPLTFEATAARVEEAAAKPGRGKKVIAITLDGYLQPEARDGDERTYGPRSFKYADGKEHVDDYPRRKYVAKPCDHAVLGVVAAGDRYGETFEVCVARDKCQVHWSKEQAAKAKTASGGAGAKKKAANARAREEQTWKQRQAAAEAERKTWKAEQPAALTAFREHVKTLSSLTAFLGTVTGPSRKELERLLDAPITASNLGAAIALEDVRHNTWRREEFVHVTKPYGFKLPARQATKPAAPAAAKKAKKR